ncbi:NUDIX domain-containing protein [Candidatus Dojkabacteria bacterium]|nr:NUDIX domain-containing protein [Candidatus Dojkabacteria bacterium]
MKKQNQGVLGFIKKRNKTLMLYRNKKINDLHKGKWLGIGGGIEVGESPEEALSREVKEETGLLVQNAYFRGLAIFVHEKVVWYGYVFLVNRYSGQIQKCKEGELKWIENNNLCKLNIWPSYEHIFALLEKPNFFTAKFVHSGSKLIDFTINKY